MQSKPIIAIVVLSLIASLPVAGCTSNQTKEAQNAQVSVSAQYQGSYTPPSSESAAQPGYQYVKFYVIVKNLNETGVNYLGDPFDFKLFDNNNQVYNTSRITATTSDAVKVVRNSKPGDTTAGSLVFEAKQGVTPQKLVYDDGANNVTVTF
jgi:hypothetical protein